MRQPFQLSWRRLILLTVAVTGLATALVEGQAQLGQPTTKKEEQKKYYFEMADVPWKKVVDWVSEKTSTPVATPNLPTGTFTFKAPKGPDGKLMEYTIGEIIDIINDSLQKQNFTLLRSHATLSVWPASDKIPQVVIPLIDVKDLAERGKTEIVAVVMNLNNASPSELAVDAKKILGTFGEVIPLEKSAQLWMQGRAGFLKMAVDTVKKVDDQGMAQMKTLNYPCKWMRAGSAAEYLKTLLGEASESVTIKGKDGTMTVLKKWSVVADEQNNAVIVVGTPDKVNRAEELLKQLDVKNNNDQYIPGPFYYKQYSLTAGTNADSVAVALGEIYKKKSPNIIIKSTSPSTVLVYANLTDHLDIKKYFEPAEEPKSFTAFKLIPLVNLDASPTATQLKAMFPTPDKGGPFIDYQVDQNAIIIKGSTQQVSEVEKAIDVLKGTSLESEGGNTRVIVLGKGSAAVLAEALAEMLPKIRKNPITLVIPGQVQDITPDGTKPKFEPQELTPLPKNPFPPSKAKGAGSEPGQIKPNPNQISYYPEPQFVEPQGSKGGKEEPVKPGNKNLPGDEGKPIVIKAVGNKLMISSDDPKALAEVQQLINLLTKAETTEGDFAVLRLKHADAVEAAKVLDEVFNGKPQSGSSKGGGFGGFNPISMIQQFAAPDAKVSGSPQAERIRVVADPATNSLIIKANLLDLMTIKKLLAKAIDTGENDSYASFQTFVIGPLQHADATEMAEIIADVYKQNMGGAAQSASVDGFRGFQFFGSGGSPQPSSGGSGNKKVTLSVGIDDRTNSLIVRSPKDLYEDVKKLVDQIEKLSADNTVTIKVIPIKGVDPNLVEQAINAIQGKATTSTKGSYSGSNFSGSNYPGSSGYSGYPGSSGFSGSFRPPGMSGFSGGSPFSGGISPFSRPPGGGSSGKGSGKGGGKKVSAGPDFFGQAVKDDHLAAFYDPQNQDNNEVNQDPSEEAEAPFQIQKHPTGTTPVRVVNYQAKPQPPDQPAGTTKGGATQVDPNQPIKGPKGGVTVEAIPELGIMVLKAPSQADIDEVLRIIDMIQKIGAGAEIDIELVPLENADPFYVTNILNQLFSRVNLGATSTTSVAGKAPTATAPTTPTIGLPFQIPGLQQQQPQQGTQQQAQQATPAGATVLIPIPRLSAILVAAHKARMEDIKKEIARLDVKNAATAKATPFQLKNAAAAQVSQTLTTFYATRYPNDSNAVRITVDTNTNTVFVQAAPADMEEIRELIWRLDNTVSGAESILLIIPLKNAMANDLALLVSQAISGGAMAPSAAGGGVLPQIGQQPGGAFPGQTPGLIPGQAPGAIPGLPGVGSATGTVTKVSLLKFFSKDQKTYQSGILQDVRISADPRLNALIVSAPNKTMDLVLALIKDLDVLPLARSEINIFTLKTADASTVATQLQQLFMGATTGGATQPGAIPGGAFPGGAFPGGAFPGGGIKPPLFNFGGAILPGNQLVDLRITVDLRTNSIIVAGNPNDLAVIESIISRLEDTPLEGRRSQVLRLKNAIAADVATALVDFLNQTLTNYQNSGNLTGFQILQRQVVIVPESISNSLLISATPKYFDEMMQIVIQLDRLPPQVLIQALIAEVTIENFNEFGVELGLQSPILFQRSLIPGGVAINNISQIGVPGFNFNSTDPLGNSTNVSPNKVGVQSLGNFGLGRTSSFAGVGGLVFSAASDSVSVLVRALQTQGRLDVLSAPKVMTADNQAARVFVGQYFPFITNSTVNTGTVTGIPTIVNSIDYRDVGVSLQVTPKINPDGSVVMRVVPVVSAVANTTVELTAGVFATAFDTQTVETTVIAQDGETVVLGGLIKRANEKDEAKVPWLGDLPGVGSLFRYRQQKKKKTELLIILTPEIVRCRADADRILTEESGKIDWNLPEILRHHGPHGMEPVMPGFNPAPPGWLRPSPSPYYGPGGPIVPYPGMELLPTPAPALAPGGVPTPAPGVPPAPAPSPPVIHDNVPVFHNPAQNLQKAPAPNAVQPQHPAPAQPQVSYPTAHQPALLPQPMPGQPPAQGTFTPQPTTASYPPPGGVPTPAAANYGQPAYFPPPPQPNAPAQPQPGAAANVPFPATMNTNPNPQGRESQPWPYYQKKS